MDGFAGAQGHRGTGFAVALRRVLLCGCASVAAGPAVAQTPDTIGRLWDPGRVQQRERTTAGHNDSLVRAIESGLRCTCGCNLDVYTCRTTDFTCATSPAMHRAVLARLDSALAAGYEGAQAAQRVTAGFELQYGQSVLMAPPKRGFNWAAYLMPFAGLGLGVGIVVGLMRRWIRARPLAHPRAPERSDAVSAVGDVPLDDLERVKRELERFEA